MAVFQGGSNCRTPGRRRVRQSRDYYIAFPIAGSLKLGIPISTCPAKRRSKGFPPAIRTVTAAALPGESLAPTLCAATVAASDGVATGLAASDEGYLVSVGKGVESRERQTGGCPGAGEVIKGIEVDEGEVLPGPLAQGDDLWVARTDRVDVYDAVGAQQASS